LGFLQFLDHEHAAVHEAIYAACDTRLLGTVQLSACHFVGLNALFPAQSSESVDRLLKSSFGVFGFKESGELLLGGLIERIEVQVDVFWLRIHKSDVEQEVEMSLILTECSSR
jgi:hypothetical protein